MPPCWLLIQQQRQTRIARMHVKEVGQQMIRYCKVLVRRLSIRLGCVTAALEVWLGAIRAIDELDRRP